MSKIPDNLRPKQLEMPLEKVRELQELGGHNVDSVLDAPDPAKIQARMAELRQLGLQDIPWTDDVKSSMRTYAEASLVIGPDEREEDGSRPRFITLCKDLIAMADELEKRFNLRPCGPDEMIGALKEHGSKVKIRITQSVLEDSSKKAAEEMLNAIGLKKEEVPPEMLAKLVAEAKKSILKNAKTKGFEVEE